MQQDQKDRKVIQEKPGQWVRRVNKEVRVLKGFKERLVRWDRRERREQQVPKDRKEFKGFKEK